MVLEKLPAIQQVGCNTRQVQEVRLPLVAGARIGAIHSLYSDDKGNLYLSDEFNHAILSLDSSGRFRWHREGKGAEFAQFVYPTGISCGWLSRTAGIHQCLAVADAWNRRVQFFDLDGQFLNAWGGFKDTPYGEVSDVRYLPRTPATGASRPSSDGIWLVLDRGNHRICIHDSTGNALLQIGHCLSPSLSRRWSLPGNVVTWDTHVWDGIPEFKPFDYLHYPVRLLGDGTAGLYVWERYARELKRLICGQLIPVPYHPNNLTEWISASETGLLGWDSRNSKLMLCTLNGELYAEVAVSGTPIVSNLRNMEVWLQTDNTLRRLILEIEEQGLTRKFCRTSDAGTAMASAYFKASTDLDSAPSIGDLSRISETSAELADEALSLSRQNQLSPGVVESILDRLRSVTSEIRGTWVALGALLHPWSVAILLHQLAALAGDNRNEGTIPPECLGQWKRLADRMKSHQSRLLMRSDALLMALEKYTKDPPAATQPEGIRDLLLKVRNSVHYLLNLYSWFAIDSVPSDPIYHMPREVGVSQAGTPMRNVALARISPLVSRRLVPSRILRTDLKQPLDIAFTGTNDLWLTDFGEKALYRIHENEKRRLAADRLQEPLGLMEDSEDGVVVSDRTSRSIWHVRNDGSSDRVFECPGEWVDIFSSERQPGGLRFVGATDPQLMRGRILVLDSQWRLLSEIRKAGDKHLGAIADLAALPDGNLVVIDRTEGATIWVLSLEGSILCVLRPNHPFQKELSVAQYLAVGTDGSLFISDSSYGCVRWYTPDLKERFIFGRGLLSKPTGIAVRNNILIVSDFATGSLVEFTISALNEVGSELSREKSQGS